MMKKEMSKSSSFSRTCSRLSQFLKERRSLGDQSCFAFPQLTPLPPSSKFDPKRVERELEANKGTVSLLPKNVEREGHVSGGYGENTKSFNLFPMNSPSAEDQSPKNTANMREFPIAKEEPEPTSASMTIFYAGKVLIFNDFPNDKAQEILSLASQGVTKNTCPHVLIQTQTSTSTSPNDMPADEPEHGLVSQESGAPSELPIARRTSLFRFIEKRKDRIASTGPYQVHNSSSNTGRMANSNPQRYNAVMRTLCQQLQGGQPQKQLDLKL